MAGQPTAGGQWTSIGTLGTTVVKSTDAVLQRVIIPGTYVGTVIFHDANVATGTSGTSAFLSLGIPTTTIPQSLPVGIQCRKGLLTEATGTPVMTLVWD